MSRKTVDALRALKKRNRYVKGLFAWIGLRTRVIQYDRQPRAAGETKWDYPGLVGLAFEGLTSFSTSPLRWATIIGLIVASIGALFGLWIVVKAMMLGDAASGYPSLVAIISFLGGIVVCQGIPTVMWLLLFRQEVANLRKLPWWQGTLLTLLLTGPWYLLAELKTPGFLDYCIVGEHIRRLLLSDIGRAGNATT